MSSFDEMRTNGERSGWLAGNAYAHVTEAERRIRDSRQMLDWLETCPEALRAYLQAVLVTEQEFVDGYRRFLAAQVQKTRQNEDLEAHREQDKWEAAHLD